MKIKIGVCLFILSLLIFPLTVLVMYICKIDSLENIANSLFFVIPTCISLILLGAFLIKKGEID